MNTVILGILTFDTFMATTLKSIVIVPLPSLWALVSSRAALRRTIIGTEEVMCAIPMQAYLAQSILRTTAQAAQMYY